MTKTKSKKNMIKRNKMDEKQEKEQLTMKKNKKIFIITFVICFIAGFAEAVTTYGKVGVKVWIYKGEVLPVKSSKEGSEQ